MDIKETNDLRRNLFRLRKEAKKIIEEYLEKNRIVTYGDWILDSGYGEKVFFDEELHFSDGVHFHDLSDIEFCITDRAEELLEIDREQLERKIERLQSGTELFDYDNPPSTQYYSDYLTEVMDDFFGSAETKSPHILTLIRALLESDEKDIMHTIYPPDEEFPKFGLEDSFPIWNLWDFLRAFERLTYSMALIIKADEIEKIVEKSRAEAREERDREHKARCAKGGRSKRLNSESKQIKEATEYLEKNNWAKLLHETENYITWRSRNNLKPFAASTATDHLKRARELYEASNNKRNSK